MTADKRSGRRNGELCEHSGWEREVGVKLVGTTWSGVSRTQLQGTGLALAAP